MNELTVKNLPLNVKSTLNTEQKKALVKLVESEYSRKGDINDAIISEKQEQLLDDYRKQVGFDKLVATLNNANKAQEEASKALLRVGLANDGSICRYNSEKISPIAKKGLDRIDNLMKAVRTEYDIQTFKNKIIARLWLAATYGEAMVLLHEVLGNDIIPTVSKKDISE